MKKEIVFLPGASGSMGFEAFKELWKKRDNYKIVLLQRPSRKNKKLFKLYEKKCGINSIQGKGIVEGNGLKIIWGDATNFEDIKKACEDIDWCLCPMALISPAADKNPEMAKAVNTTAIKSIIKAIESQPGGSKHIKLISIGTVAATGDRLPPIHHGRIGDPMKPSVFDYYAITKIRGEMALCESDLKYWASLRQTFIMVPDIMALMDPIMFHQPINSFMENNTSRDAGRALINCLDIPEDSDFWRKCYNMGGGPSCRTTYYEFLNRIMEMNGVGKISDVTERKWFALRNFHMQYYDDSYKLNEYIRNWGDSLEDYFTLVRKNIPFHLKIVKKVCDWSERFQKLVQKQTRKRLKNLAMDKTGTLYWYKNRMDMRISAFYKDYKTFESIPDWGEKMPKFSDQEPEWYQLDHGYDEFKEQLELEDLKNAAKFRGGECLITKWDGNMYAKIKWRCAFGHKFELKPYTVLKAGHWCPECLPPPWNYDEQAKKNPFFAQVWYPNHDKDENNYYPADCYKDILD
ncbi:MAG: NAD(P)-dependent oxidoreductase [Promethearchaeota archaeon]|nr:MAG: NAD(P)-dependent oxidoreductase [Candidatus Lokiarchaeota archaeon]